VLDRLVQSGMTIGFHTLRHPLLTLLEAGSLEREVTEGQEALEDIASQRISLFAYPHGKGDARTAQGVRGAGYRPAVTGQAAPISRRSDPYLIGRWEPGDLKTHDFVISLAAKLYRPSWSRRLPKG
jgi:peptidoglycan/xylan/chitin deacetylase (PgdA/CDA1 family)